ncbi:MAG TPA: pantoate--beta-alanine ligase [Mycobacteriales bacterium]|nr:pantoate--beta-alanine ligase [Mycobacteriales bacterium]
MTPPAMTVARNRDELASARLAMPGPVAVVLTMGALHAGHAALLATARAAAASVLVTLFVNPLQFGPAEDFARYPRTPDDDLEKCAASGVDLVFAPTVTDVYPHGEPAIRVSAGRLGDRWEGASRPGHFDGALTVVTKLFQLTRPDVAVFGEKDAQQLLLVRRLVTDLDLPVAVLSEPTVRDHDGLALSSRNRHLDAADRTAALAIPRALEAARVAVARGAVPGRAAAAGVLAGQQGLELDYCVLVDEADLDEVPDDWRGPARLLVAARVGTTRLIDNCRLDVRVPENPPLG